MHGLRGVVSHMRPVDVGDVESTSDALRGKRLLVVNAAAPGSEKAREAKAEAVRRVKALGGKVWCACAAAAYIWSGGPQRYAMVASASTPPRL